MTHSGTIALDAVQWRAVFEHAGVGIAMTDLTGRFLASNRAYQEIVGYTAEELEGMSVLDLTHEDDRAPTAELAAQMVRGLRLVARVDKRYRRKDGKVVWVRLTGTSIPGPDGIPALLMGVVEDITDGKLAEDEVRLSEAYLADAQRISRTGSWVLNPFTGSLYWSRETYRICGFDPSDGPPTYTAWLDRVHPDDAGRVDADVHRGIQNKTDFEGTYRLLHPDGGIRYIHYLGHTVVGRDGEVERCIGTIADVTAEKLAEERVNRVQDEERRRIARQLHETTAQDLAALKLNLAALERNGAVANAKDRSLLREGAALATQAMEDIRVLSYVLHPPLLDEAGLEPALGWYLEGFERRSGIEVRLVVPEEFGRLPQEVEMMLFRCVQESLNNIHRHSQSATAEIRLRRQPSRVVLEVQDWGRGMPPGGRRRREGVGIAGMRERVQQLGGELEIESGAGGTTVRAALPAPPEDQ